MSWYNILSSKTVGPPVAPTVYLRKSSPMMFIVQVTFWRWGLEKDEHFSGLSLFPSV